MARHRISPCPPPPHLESLGLLNGGSITNGKDAATAAPDDAVVIRDQGPGGAGVWGAAGLGVSGFKGRFVAGAKMF